MLPGGGALNVAWHWRSLGLPFRLVSRIGDEDATLFLEMLDRHEIDYGSRDAIVRDGPSASIDIEILPDREIWMDHYVEGVCADLRFTAQDEALLKSTKRLHAILVEGVIAEVARLGDTGRLEGIEVVADFLASAITRHPVRRHDALGRHGDRRVARLSRRGDVDAVGGSQRARQTPAVTFGSHAILLIDGRTGVERQIAVDPVPVAGTTVGCGDAFIAYMLHELWASGDLLAAAERGKIGGALPTGWMRPLPDDAYGPSPVGH